ncbi:MAG: HD domain-containing protein [Nitrospirae bacterium]|nr:HD domain-containing protein [Nitrospirota bacterium]
MEQDNSKARYDGAQSPFRSEVSEPIHKGARALINQMQVLFRTSQIHDIGNVALVRPVTNMMNALDVIFRSEPEFTVRLRGEYLYLDQTRIRYDIEDMASYEYMVEALKEKKIGSITFQQPVTPDDIKRFAYTFSAMAPDKDDSHDELNERLAQRGVKSMWTGAVEEQEQIKFDDLADRRKMAKKTYFQAVSVTRGVMNNIKSEQPTHLKKVKRVIQGIVDIILKEESSIMGLTTIKDFDEYTYNHCVNVSILAMTIGQKLGFDKNLLTSLGIASLFHDIGKVDVPIDILNKPSSFTEDEWEIVKRHPVMGVKAISKVRGLNELAASSMVVAFEHHIFYDMTGYPQTRNKMMPNFFSRIVSIADQYDSMTSARVYSRIPYTPDKALSLMMERSGVQLDPLLFKIFANIIGVYPIGTLVMMDTRELGLVYESNPNPEKLDRPKVILITDSVGKRVTGRTVDLGEKDPSGRYKRTIFKALDPKKYNINLAEYFL